MVTAGFRLPTVYKWVVVGSIETPLITRHVSMLIPPDMLPVEKTRTDIMNPNVRAMRVMKGTWSIAAGVDTTVVLEKGLGGTSVVVKDGACRQVG